VRIPLTDQAQESKEFRSDNIVVKMRREPGCTVIMEITVTPIATQAAYQKALKNVNKEFSYPGFRKGHAPPQIIEQKFGNHVNDEWRNILAKTTFSEALDLAKVFPRTEKSVWNVDIRQISKDGAELYLEFESHPDVPEIDLKEFSFATGQAIEVTDKEIEDAIYELRFEKATYQPVDDREAQEGDFVMIDAEMLHENKTYPMFKGRVFQVGASQTPPWIDRLIKGLKAGDSAEGEIGDCTAEDHTGHVHDIARLKVLEVSTGELAPMNEELFKQVGAENEETLRAQIKNRLFRQKEEWEFRQKMTQMENFLLDRLHFDVPKSMYESSSKKMAQKQIDALKREQGWEETFVEKSAEIKNSVEDEMKRALRRFLIAQKVAHDNNLHVNEQELHLEHIREVVLEGRPEKMDENDIPRLYSKILQNKAMAFLTENTLRMKG